VTFQTSASIHFSSRELVVQNARRAEHWRSSPGYEAVSRSIAGN